MTPSQRNLDTQGKPRVPQYSNLAQVAFTDPQIAKRITKHLPEDWSVKRDKETKKKNSYKNKN